MLHYALQDALSIGDKQYLDNARSAAFSQRSSSTHLIEDETSNDSEINNLIDYEDGQEEANSLRMNKIYAGIQLSNRLEKHFLKIDT
ncbi:uncharacterized protein TNCV_73031 [Trichonephila clavipes]|uniref:Uncharacterized protein n=1 Tax=Trichonephila clavipes TaxID=2585209 RepID=A0A8X6RFR9_TRICX|nr:uncharacterized protein TNCV_73031 [Trichonephila clavipes]